MPISHRQYLNNDWDFRPLPFLGNPHVQTVLAFLVPGNGLTSPSQERLVVLPDGDQLVLHDSIPPEWRPGQRIGIVVHGLGGSHRSAHVVRQSGALLRAGFRVIRVDLRGCGRGARLAQGTYHAGCSEDLRVAVTEVHRWSPESPLVLVGQSLGGNVVLKLAGEAADVPVPGLAAVVAIGAPIDLLASSIKLARPSNVIYDRFFVRTLVGHLERRRRFFPQMSVPRFPRPLTVRLFDEIYTAVAMGYSSAEHYYRGESSMPKIPRIGVPTLLLTARDDPFIAVEPFEHLQVPNHIAIRIVDQGGHMGFLGRDARGGMRWGEQEVARWAVQNT